MQQQSTLTFAVAAYDTPTIVEALGNYRKDKKKFDSLNEMFGIATMLADFKIPESSFVAALIANGTGYYDPMIYATFTYDGEVIGTGRTISAVDIRTNRRLFIVVLKPGVNVVIHDRFPQTSTRTCLVATTPTQSARALIGMTQSVWEDGVVIDMVNAGDFFGFEIDRRNAQVYIPYERTINKIRAAINMFAEADSKLKKRFELAA